MENCTNCKSPLIKDAAFCTACGTKVDSAYIDCPDCGHENDTTALFCSQCGYELSFINQEAEATKTLNTSDPEALSKDLLGYFMRALRRRIVVDHQSQQLEEYLTAFYKTKFNQRFMVAVQQLADEITEQKEDVFANANQQGHTAFIDQRMQGLLDYFIIHDCKDLNDITLPESILKYQNTALVDVDMPMMIEHFFDWKSEEEKIYTDFLVMPLDKLKAASKHFLFPPKNEKIWMICDQSVLGSCKEGFALTQKGLYWKAHFQEPQVVLYEDLKSIEKQQDWILVNDKFFNVNPSVNLKMMYFLRKVKQMCIT